MKIVVELPFFGPSSRVRGPVLQAMEVCRQLTQRGHSVAVVTTSIDVDEGTKINDWVERDGFRVFYARAAGLQSAPPYYASSVRNPLREVIRDADVLYLRVGLTLTNEIARRLAAQFRVPYVYNAEGCLCPVRLRVKRIAKWGFLRLFERRILRQAARLHAATEKEAADYVTQGADRTRIDVIPNGVLLPDLAAGDSKAMEFKRRLGIQSGFVLLYLGRIVELKGPDRLLAAFQRIKEQVDAHLVIAGPESPLAHQLQQRARESGLERRVHFPGVIQGEEKEAALSAADVFVLPSESEGLPNAVLEALAHGIPCMVSADCHIPEIDEYNAGVISGISPDQIATSLTGLLTEPERLQQMRKAARSLAERRFAMPTVIDKIESSLERARSRSSIV